MGKIKGLLGLLIVAGSFYAAWNWIPIKWTNYQFQDELDDICRKNSYINQSDEDLKQIVVNKAQTMELPVKAEQVTISHGPAGLAITVHYHIHRDWILNWKYDDDVTANSLNKRI